MTTEIKKLGKKKLVLTKIAEETQAKAVLIDVVIYALGNDNDAFRKELQHIVKPLFDEKEPSKIEKVTEVLELANEVIDELGVSTDDEPPSVQEIATMIKKVRGKRRSKK